MYHRTKRSRRTAPADIYPNSLALVSGLDRIDPEHVSFQPLQEDKSPLPVFDTNLRGSKRAYVNAFSHDSKFRTVVGSEYSSFYPTVPIYGKRVVNLDTANPFIVDKDSIPTHPRLVGTPRSCINGDVDLEVNAFIKIRWNRIRQKNQISLSDKMPLRMSPTPMLQAAAPKCGPHQQWGGHEEFSEVPSVTTWSTPGIIPIHGYQHFNPSIAQLPRNFGAVRFESDMDRILYRFFINAICTGRTVVMNDNAYRTEIAPMAEKSRLVYHAILSLSSTYVLDYQRNEKLEMIAQRHHNYALNLLSQELGSLPNYTPGKEEAVVAALMLLSHNEVVNWEVGAKESKPKWYRSGKVAEHILEASDPAYSYRLPRNVQCTKARFALGQLFCLDNIMSDCVYPLDLNVQKCSFTWLLHGDENENRKIVGMTGLSSQLMHYFAKITFLAARMNKNSPNEVSYWVACEIKKMLHNFFQWSEITRSGYETPEELLGSCNLDAQTKVTTAEEVTNLIAESYVAAAQIYLQCRVFRYPRHQESVQMTLIRLLKCIQWQPTSGKLFTAQTPLFAVFIAATVAFREEHRKIINEWFEPICKESRGNVKPAKRAVECIWVWADEWENQSSIRTDVSEDTPLSDRPVWWETMVEVLAANEGRLNLS